MDARQRRRWAWLTGIWAVLVATGGLLTVSWQQESASGRGESGWHDAEDGSGSGDGEDGDVSGNPMHGSVPVTPQPEESERSGELRPSIRLIPPEGGVRDSVTIRPEPVPGDGHDADVRPREWQPAPDPGTGR
ncbi:hypothetical protein [Streptomyces sp. NPDC007083]|uniref:hypothetical protein n=1 Tax=unclassified Streptomyces TaxID=2593676 RepID=UPI0033DF6137